MTDVSANEDAPNNNHRPRVETILELCNTFGIAFLLLYIFYNGFQKYAISKILHIWIEFQVSIWLQFSSLFQKRTLILTINGRLPWMILCVFMSQLHYLLCQRVSNEKTLLGIKQCNYCLILFHATTLSDRDDMNSQSKFRKYIIHDELVA